MEYEEFYSLSRSIYEKLEKNWQENSEELEKINKLLKNALRGEKEAEEELKTNVEKVLEEMKCKIIMDNKEKYYEIQKGV